MGDHTLNERPHEVLGTCGEFGFHCKTRTVGGVKHHHAGVSVAYASSSYTCHRHGFAACP